MSFHFQLPKIADALNFSKMPVNFSQKKKVNFLDFARPNFAIRTLFLNLFSDSFNPLAFKYGKYK